MKLIPISDKENMATSTVWSSNGTCEMSETVMNEFNGNKSNECTFLSGKLLAIFASPQPKSAYTFFLSLFFLLLFYFYLFLFLLLFYLFYFYFIFISINFIFFPFYFVFGLN